MANEEKLLNLVNVIGAAKDRGEWNQDFWCAPSDEAQCGTAFCAAGWQAQLDGKLQLSTTALDFIEETVDGELIPDYAERALELTFSQANVLFYHVSTDYDEFVDAVKKIISGEIQ